MQQFISHFEIAFQSLVYSSQHTWGVHPCCYPLFTAEATETERRKVFCPKAQQGQGKKLCIHFIMSLFSICSWQGTMFYGAQRWVLDMWPQPCRKLQSIEARSSL